MSTAVMLQQILNGQMTASVLDRAQKVCDNCFAATDRIKSCEEKEEGGGRIR